MDEIHESAVRDVPSVAIGRFVEVSRLDGFHEPG
jgi:hypothetical protein